MSEDHNLATVCFVSDTHNRHDFECRRADVLIHCGDLTNHGSIRELVQGFAWLDRQPHKHVAFLPGNHDLGLDPDHRGGMDAEDMLWLLRQLYPRVTILEAGMNAVGPLVVAAAPWMHLQGWGFYTEQDVIKDGVERIIASKGKPHVLVSHDPPFGTLDRAEGRLSRTTGKWRPEGSVGQTHYRQLGNALGAQVHAFGHIHEWAGESERDPVTGLLYLNVARLERDYTTPAHDGMIATIDL